MHTSSLIYLGKRSLWYRYCYLDITAEEPEAQDAPWSLAGSSRVRTKPVLPSELLAAYSATVQQFLSLS